MRTPRSGLAVPGRVVLVTGCSSGLGLETAVTLAERGWKVFATMRDPASRSGLDAAVTARFVPEHRVAVHRLDVTEAGSIASAVEEVMDATGGVIDAVVHNAGVNLVGCFEDLPDAECRRVFETNFFGVLELTRVVLPAMRAQRRGRIALVSSDSAFFGSPTGSIYAASKWALEGWAESIAYELKPFGINVALIEPGAYQSAIWDSTRRVKQVNGTYEALVDIIQHDAEPKFRRRARAPREVAAAVACALEARRPRFRYPVGPDAKAAWTARGVVPHLVVAWAVRRVMGISRWRPLGVNMDRG